MVVLNLLLLYLLINMKPPMLQPQGKTQNPQKWILKEWSFSSDYWCSLFPPKPVVHTERCAQFVVLAEIWSSLSRGSGTGQSCFLWWAALLVFNGTAQLRSFASIGNIIWQKYQIKLQLSYSVFWSDPSEEDKYTQLINVCVHQCSKIPRANWVSCLGLHI